MRGNPDYKAYMAYLNYAPEILAESPPKKGGAASDGVTP